MKKTIVFYETYYGTAQKTAEIFAKVIGNARALSIDSEGCNLCAYDNAAFVFAFHGYSTGEKTIEYVKSAKDILKDKKVMFIGVGLSRNDMKTYSHNIRLALERKNDYEEFVEGELRVGKLTDKDRKTLEPFLSAQNMKLMDMGVFKAEDVIALGEKYRGIFEIPDVLLERKELQKTIDEFIKGRNTCVLATGYGSYIRSTPIEYIYDGKRLYFLTEGGMKFKGILLNPNVSVSIYDNYDGFGNLKGLQIMGKAEAVEDALEYERVIVLRGLNMDNLNKLPVKMNMIKVSIESFEFLNSDFKKQGFDTKQILKF